MFKEECQFFTNSSQKIEEEETEETFSFYETSITFIPIPDKDITRNLQITIFYDYGHKSQQISKLMEQHRK